MKLCKIAIKKLILIIVLISVLLTFFATPVSNAELDLEEGDFYYSGTTEGSYKPKGSNIFAWFLESLGDIADWILGILTLGIRMVFVGWTALLEKLLTWGVESASGVHVDGTIVSDPTDLTSITDSDNNITVEAIVYNKVAALDADIFETEFDRTLSATGHRLVCEKCEEYTDDLGLRRYKSRYADECIPAATAEAILANPEAYADAELSCSCACGGCDACQIYWEQLKIEEPIIVRVKQLIATWYYVIRMLAMAIMLVVLIVVGIKMLISTIASDKAVYKRMLVDWVVGVIMLFTLHYFMILVIEINAIMVGLIEEFAQSVNQASLTQAAEDLNMDLEEELAAKDLEIRVYEEIRSRAYDAKLTNGMMGMIMYMALVFMAIKFTVIYVKRLFTIMVLTLMAPGIGVAYALQKVLSGKSQALKTWMTEYIMNVIIQIVHALIYAIFISQAFILSLTNISGMIVALILMNYTSKAEEVFKKIFKFGGKDSLLGHTENAMDALKENIQATKKLATGAKPAAALLTNTPYAKALKGIGKAAVGGAIVAGSKAYHKYNDGREDRKYQRQWDKEYSRVEAEHSSHNTRSDRDAEVEEMQREATQRLRDKGIIDPRITRAENDRFLGTPKADYQEKLDQATASVEAAKVALDQKPTDPALRSAYDDAVKQQVEAQENMDKYHKLTELTTRDIVKGHAEKIFDIENVFKIKKPTGLTDFKTHTQNLNSVSDALFGTAYFDPKKMKYVRKNDGLYTRLSSENALGLTQDDKKVFKEQIALPMLQSFGGMISLFAGMGTFVTQPKVGMALLAAGIPATHKTFHRKPNNDKYKNKKYKFSRFSAGAINTMKENAIDQTQKQLTRAEARRLKQNRKGFVERFRNGDLRATTLRRTASVGNSAGKTGAEVAQSINMSNSAKLDAIKEMVKSSARTVAAPVGYVGGKFYRKMGISENMENVQKHVLTQRKKLEEGIREEAVNMMGTQTQAEMAHLMAVEFDKLDAEETREANEQGYDFNPQTRVMTRKETVEESDLVETKLTKSKPSYEKINSMLDKILVQAEAKGKGDFSSKGNQMEVMQQLTFELQKAKLISSDERAEDVFKGGKEGLVKVMKGKSAKLKETTEATTSLQSLLSADEFKSVQDMTRSATRGESVNSVLSKISGQINQPSDGSRRADNQPSDGSRIANPTEAGRRVDASKTGDSVVVFADGSKKAAAKNAAVTKYVTTMTSGPKTMKAPSKDSKKKVAEALSMMLPDDGASYGTENKPTEPDLSIERMIEQVQTTGTVKRGGKEVKLTAAEASTATRMLEKLLEMKAVNEVAIKDLNMKKGTKEYVKSREKKSTLAIQISQLEKEQLQHQQGSVGEPAQKYTGAVRDPQQHTGSVRDPQQNSGAVKVPKSQDAASIHNRIKQKTAEMNKVDQRMKMSGPAVDINSVLKDINKAASGSRKRGV